ncbi:MAG: insulinase family protein [Chitinophagaceae bacterium]|nr:insulinase family protein [Chitinophagaceae bacterium]
MVNNILNKRNVLLLMLVACFTIAQAQLNLNEKLPLDTSVIIGKLPNGLTYYIKSNKKPEQKVELRLVVNAGSINETDDQSGLAHMAEHMAFNGTKNFKKNDIVSFLQDIGVGFGSDLNANTGFDRTIYILPVPTDKKENIEKGFRVLEDWAHNVTYLSDDIDNERSIILEESRLGKGAEERIFKKVLPGLMKGSLYAERWTIGKDSIIKTFKHDAIRKYYKDWYRPDLMAVIVVGDITKGQAEEMIKKHFSSLTNPAGAPERKYADVPPYPSNDAMIVTDKEATTYDAVIAFSAYKVSAPVTVGDYMQKIAKSIFTTMLNKRLQELTQKENPPFVYAGAQFGGFARGFENFEVYTGAGDKEPTTAVKTAIEEIEKVKRFGFTAPELERAKKNILAAYEQAYNDRNKTESSSFVEEYINNFLEQSPVPGIVAEYDLVKQVLPAITLADVNKVADRIKAGQNIFAYIAGPEAANVKLPGTADLLNIIAAAEKADVKPYEEKTVATDLLAQKPTAGKVTATKTNTALGTTELTLSNGITVTLKPTDFKDNEILMGASRYGGTSNYGIADRYNATYVNNVIGAMGYGNFSPVDLQKALAGKSISVLPAISTTSEGINGSATVKDLETMFQLAYLKLTSPRKDTSLFKSFVQKNKAQLAMLGANPEAVFFDTTVRTFYNNNPLAPINVPKPSYFDSINVDRVIQIYKERLGDLSGMHFVFTGSFKQEDIIPLIETYIASLPASNKKFNYVDRKLRPVSGKKSLTVYKGQEQKSMVIIFYTGELPYSEALAFKASAISEVLNIRIIEELREKIQGIYGGGIFGEVNKVPYNNYRFIAQLPCGPEKADTLIKALQNEINTIVKNGPSVQNLNKVKQQWRESHKEEIKQNGPWLQNLLASKTEGDNIDRFVNFDTYVDKLTVKEVQDAAKLFFNGKNQFTAILMPADKEKK